jgi:hypothetical protein
MNVEIKIKILLICKAGMTNFFIKVKFSRLN